MLNLNCLLLPGESADSLRDLQQEWYAACDPAEPAHRARVDAAITANWLYLRADHMYQVLRHPSCLEIDTPALEALMSRRGELRRAVRVYKKLLGFSTRRAHLRHVLTNTEDFDDIQLNAA